MKYVGLTFKFNTFIPRSIVVSLHILFPMDNAILISNEKEPYVWLVHIEEYAAYIYPYLQYVYFNTAHGRT